MSEFIRKQCVVRNNGSHFELLVEYTKDVVEQDDTADDLSKLLKRLERTAVRQSEEFKGKMAIFGYKWVEIYMRDGEAKPYVMVTPDCGIKAMLKGDLHAPFDEECVRKACEEACIELVTVNEN